MDENNNPAAAPMDPAMDPAAAPAVTEEAAPATDAPAEDAAM